MRTEEAASARDRKYPFRCAECGHLAVRPAIIPYDGQRNHDGTSYKLHVRELHVTRCTKCGEVYLSDDADRELSAALREHLALLSPESIRASLAELKLSQKQAAERLGIAPETMSRWLSGTMIQSRAMDNLLRVFFACKEARQHLSLSSHSRTTAGRR